MEARLAVKALRMALMERCPSPGLVHHSDRGVQYASQDYTELLKQHNVLMSPLVWDLGHIGNFEELWLVQRLANAKPTNPQYDDMYDAFEHPRRTRAGLPLLDRYPESSTNAALPPPLVDP